jgi:putative transposon-encoded protein
MNIDEVTDKRVTVLGEIENHKIIVAKTYVGHQIG